MIHSSSDESDYETFSDLDSGSKMGFTHHDDSFLDHPIDDGCRLGRKC